MTKIEELVERDHRKQIANSAPTCLEGAFIPSTGLVSNNTSEPLPFENDWCSGLFLPMHRPTHDPALERSGKYPDGYHFANRKRLWEMRLQMTLKTEVPNRPWKFGIELEEYVPLSWSSRMAMSAVVGALKQALGSSRDESSSIYHSPGDDPKKVQEPHEKPMFVMPLWAFDQFILTEEGEEPPKLTNPEFFTLGEHRVNNRKQFIKNMLALNMRPGPTYTFAFWGISKFLDIINWSVKLTARNIDFNTFCGTPPVHVVLYTLKPKECYDDIDSEQQPDTRHLQSRKDYLFRVAFWSSMKRPPSKRFCELTTVTGDEAVVSATSEPEVDGHGWLDWLTCCASRGG